MSNDFYDNFINRRWKSIIIIKWLKNTVLRKLIEINYLFSQDCAMRDYSVARCDKYVV